MKEDTIKKRLQNKFNKDMKKGRIDTERREHKEKDT
jgi:hypothetical protein